MLVEVNTWLKVIDRLKQEVEFDTLSPEHQNLILPKIKKAARIAIRDFGKPVKSNN